MRVGRVGFYRAGDYILCMLCGRCVGRGGRSGALLGLGVGDAVCGDGKGEGEVVCDCERKS